MFAQCYWPDRLRIDAGLRVDETGYDRAHPMRKVQGDLAHQLEISRAARTSLAAAYGAAVGRTRDAPVVGTEHLLVGLAADRGTGPVSRALDAVELTLPVLMAALRKHDGRSAAWRSDDGTPADQDEAPAGPWDRYPARKPIRYTGAAGAALHRAAILAGDRGGTEIDDHHLLRGLLAASDNRASELLRGCGIEPARLLERITGTSPQATQDDPVPPELWPTRDALLGTARYSRRSPAGRLTTGMLRVLATNLAEVPTIWVELDAHDQARRLGASRTGTEHLLLAILAIHETLRWYPHMRPADADRRLAGGDVLAEAGLTHRAASEAASREPDGLGSESRPVSSYLRRLPSKASAAGTGELLLAVLTQDDCRAANLLRRLGVEPSQIRARLRGHAG
jgi:ClpA/ClpB-like protein